MGMLFKVLILGFTIALLTVLWIPFESVFGALIEVSVCDPLGRCTPRPPKDPDPDPKPKCPGGLCPMNITMTNIARDPSTIIAITGVIVGIDRDPSTIEIEPFIFTDIPSLRVGESFQLLFKLIDDKHKKITIEERFSLIINADKVVDNPRGTDDPKIKKIKVNKSINFK